jgi:hypothetical protein
MSVPEHAELLSELCNVARPIILERFRPDSCIVSTRIAIDVLDYFGIKAKALPVKLGAYNPLAWESVEKGVEPDWNGGAWGVGIGTASPIAFTRQSPSGVDGHLVALVEDTTLLDLSIDQASRPAKGITLAPYFGAIRPENLAGFEEGEGLVFRVDGDCRIVYWRHPERFHLQAPDWTDRSRRKDLVGRIIRAVR